MSSTRSISGRGNHTTRINSGREATMKINLLSKLVGVKEMEKELRQLTSHRAQSNSYRQSIFTQKIIEKPRAVRFDKDTTPITSRA